MTTDRPRLERDLQALEQLYAKDDCWEGLIDALEERAQQTHDDAILMEILSMIADTWEDRLVEPAQALSAYERMLLLDPFHDRAFTAAEKLYVGELNEAALRLLYRDRLAHTRDLEERNHLYRRWAQVFEKCLGHRKEAYLALRQALAELPGDDATADELQRLTTATHLWNDLLDWGNDLVQESSDDGQMEALLFRMAQWYHQLDRADYAVTTLDHLLTLRPRHQGALELLAHIYRSKEEWPALVQVLVHWAAHGENSVDQALALLEMGQIYENRLKQTSHAVACYQEALSLDASLTEPRQALEQIFRTGQSWPELVDLLRSNAAAATSSRAGVKLLREAARLCETELKDPQAAQKVNEEAWRRQRDSLPLMRELWRSYEEGQQWEQLAALLRHYLDVATSEREIITVRLRLAHLLEQLGQDDEAVDQLEAALAVDPAHGEALNHLVHIHRRREQWRLLAQTFLRQQVAATEKPDRIEALFAAATVYHHQAECYEAAGDAYFRVLDLDENHVPALYGLAELMETTEDWTGIHESLNVLSDLIDDPRERSDVYCRMAVNFSDNLDNDAAAYECFRKALDCTSENRQALVGMRDLCAKRDDWVGVSAALRREEALEEDPRKKSSILWLLGRIQEQYLHHHQQAIECYYLAFSHDPENLDAASAVVQALVEREQWEYAKKLLAVVQPDSSVALPPAVTHRWHLLAGQVAQALGQRAAAREAYRVAYQAVPTDVETVERLVELLQIEEDWVQLGHLAQHLVTNLRDQLSRDRLIKALYALALAWSHQDLSGQAVEVAQEILTISGRHEPALRLLIDLHRQRHDWGDVVLYQRRFRAARPAEEAAALLAQEGDVLSEQLKDYPAAIMTYRQAVELRPDDRAVWLKLLECYRATEQWPAVVEALQQLARLEEGPTERAAYRYAIALVYRDHLHDFEGALRCLDAALADDPDKVEAFAALENILTAWEDWVSLEKSYRQMLYRLQGRHPGRELELWDRLATLYLERLNHLDGAGDALQMACQLEPDNHRRRILLAEVYGRIPEAWKKAVQEHRILLRHEPRRLESYHELRRIYGGAGRADEAWCLCAALDFLRQAEPKEQAFFERHREFEAIRPRYHFSSDSWRILTDANPTNLLIGKLLATVLPFVRPLLGSRRSPLKVRLRKKDRINWNKDGTPAVDVFLRLGQLLHQPLPELYLSSDEELGLMFVDAAQPTSLIGMSLYDSADEPALAFEIGRHLCRYRSEYFLTQVVPETEELRDIARTAIALVQNGFQPSAGDGEQDIAALLAEQMTPLAKEQLAEVVRRLVKREEDIDLFAWRRAAECTACRVGLVCSQSLHAAVEGLQRAPDLPRGVVVPDVVNELISFSISDEYFRLRRQLGVGVGRRD